MATKKEQIEFVRKIYPAAARLYRSGGVHPLFVTAQAALETGWKIKGVGNNIFGITKGSSWHRPGVAGTDDRIFQDPECEVQGPGTGRIGRASGPRKIQIPRLPVFPKFRCRWMNVSDNHLERSANRAMPMRWPYRDDPKEFARRLMDGTGAKYATAPDYAEVMASVIDNVARIAKTEGLL